MVNLFYRCLDSIAPSVAAIFSDFSESISKDIQEIRIRNGMPLAVTVRGKSLFVQKSGQTSYNPNNAYYCSKDDIEKTFDLITNHSVFAHKEEIKEGFVRLFGGCRAGISGTFSKEGMIFDVSGINVRIAKEFIGCADTIFKEYNGGGALILGPPGSGKTTLLRDFIRQLSNEGYRVSVIDSRGEISASYSGKSFYNLGYNTDTYITYDKSFGVIAALRTMFPQIIAFDEIGTNAELRSIEDCFNAGVNIITTAHTGGFNDIKSRNIIENLLKTGAIQNVFLLSGNIGEKARKIGVEEIML